MFNIGSVRLANRTVFAPLAGVSNLPMRLIAKAAGCGLVCSEMISSNGLVHGSPKTHKMLESATAEKPLSVQIFGADPKIMAEAARIVASSGADILDLNFGCSVKKVLKTGAGAALMRTPKKAEALITAVRKAIQIPLTIKIRTGWKQSGEDAFILARIAEDCGVDSITVHPRVGSQGFSGKANWHIISAVKKRISIPVIGNGDIVTAHDAVRMLQETDCNAVMVGRSAIGNPWIFNQINALLNGAAIPVVNRSSRLKLMLHYLDSSVQYYGELQACYMMRSRLGWFVKGLPNCSKFRESIKQIASQDQAIQLIQTYMNSVIT